VIQPALPRVTRTCHVVGSAVVDDDSEETEPRLVRMGAMMSRGWDELGMMVAEVDDQTLYLIRE
jgi:hypothetical protein